MPQKQIHSYIGRVKLVVTIALFMFFTGCFVPHAQMVRQAQDAFQKGATVENARKFGFKTIDEAGDPMTDETAYYSSARGLIEQALEEAMPGLMRDDLYGTALTIHALTSWRLGDRKTALASAKEVLKIAKDPKSGTRIWPRDKANCTALDPLIKITDLGVVTSKFDLNSTSTVANDKLMKHVNGIRKELRDSGRSLPEGHPFKIYLAQSELELAYVVYSGLNKMHRNNRDVQHKKTYDKLREDAFAQLQEMATSRAYMKSRDKIDKLITYYTEILNEVSVPQ